MSDQSGKIKRNIKRFFGVLLVLGVILSIVAIWGWRTVRTDHAYTIKRVQEYAMEHHNAKLELSGYQLEWVEPYPTLNLVIKNVRLASVLDSMAPVLRTNHIQLRVNVKDWWMGNLKVEPVELDSAWVHLRKDAEGRSNLRFAAAREQKKIKPWSFDFEEVPEINFRFLDFHNENLQRDKWQKAQMLDGRIASIENSSGQHLLNLSSGVHFDGLMFKQKDGGYLMDRDGSWNLDFGIAEDGLALELHPSTLRVDSTEFLIDGSFHRADTNRLKLHIRNEGVRTTTVLPMLSNKIQRKLEEIKIDRPVVASFRLDELLQPSSKGVIQIDFAARDAAVNFRQLSVERTTFKGYYSNDCDGDGIGDSENDCVVFERVQGDLYGVLPTDVKGKLDNLRDPQLTAIGTMDISLPRLNDRLAASNKVTFKEGTASLQMAYQGPFDDIIEDPFNEEKVRMQGDVVFSNVILDLPTRSGPLPALGGYMHFNDQATKLEQLNLQWMGAAVQLSGTLNNLPEFLFFDDQALQSDLRLHFDHLQLGGATASTAPSVKAKAEKIDYQKIREIARKLATNVNGQIQLDIDRLTYDTILLTDIHTRFRLSSPLLYAENADSAMIQMERLSARYMGNTSFEIGLGFSQEADPKLLLDVDLPDAQVFANAFLPKGNAVKSGRVSLALKGRLPIRNFVELEQVLDSMVFTGQLRFDEVNMELASFTWPVQTLSGHLNFNEDRLELSGLNFQYEGAPFNLNGTIDHYRYFGAQQALVDLDLRGRSINRRDNQTKKKQSVQSTSSFSPAGMFQNLDTIFQLAAGRLALTLDTIYTLDHTIAPMHAILALKAAPDISDRYELHFDTLQLGLGGRNLIAGKAKIIHPERPRLEAQIRSVLNFRKLADFLPSKYIELQDGFFRMELDYQVPLYDSINAENYILGAAINGKAEIVDGKLFYNYRDFQIDDLYSHISFNNSDLNIRDLDLSLNNNRLFADGTSANFFPFFILSDRKARIALNVASPEFDFGEFTAPHGLGKDSVAVDTTTVLKKTGGFIDQLLSNGSLDMNADFDLLKYEDFQAKALRGNISLHPDTVRLDSVQMNLAKGAFLINGSITDIVYHQPKIEIDAQFRESDVRQLFHHFQNFGQSALDSSNVEGFASMDVQFRSEANSNYALLPGTMHGDLEFKLFGGQLINLPGVRKISGFLSKKRQLDHIIIDTLETNTHIRGSDLYIDQFNLNSSSFTFDVEGVYSLGEEDNTRILFGIPLSNLFRRHVSHDELKKEARARKGLKVFIEARPRKDKMRFRWKIPLSKKPYRLLEKD